MQWQEQNRDPTPSVVFDTMSRGNIWTIITKVDYPDKFMGMESQFHEGMQTYKLFLFARYNSCSARC